jgi:outer membrane protein assembly factor BamB
MVERGSSRRAARSGFGLSVVLFLVIVWVLDSTSLAQADWTTYHADTSRSGVDTSSGTPQSFSAAWTSLSLGAAMWSQPLIYQGIVIVATENNDVYALDEATGRQVWHANAGTPVPAAALPCGDISPTVGITSTPVLDAATAQLYVVADQWNGSQAAHTLIAYNAKTGAQLFSRNVDPAGSTPLDQLQRPGLALDDGRVLIGYGGNDGDCGSYWGFLVSAPANNVGANTQYKVPTNKGGAIWSGGGAPAIDSSGAVYVPTGNAASTSNSNFDHGDTVEKLDAMGNELDYFAPSSWAADSGSDADLGSTNTLLLPDGLAYQGGKNGNGYLFSTQSLGHIAGDLYHAPVCDSFGGDAYANSIIYVACANGIRAVSLNTTSRTFAALWNGPSDANGSPIIAGGLVWVTSTSDSKLYGLDPTSGAVRVTESVPPMEHFTSPSASDGKLFVATDDTLEAYIIASPAVATPPAPSPGPGPPAPAPAPPTPQAPPSPPPHACAARLSLRLTIPRRSRIVRVTLYAGKRRILSRRGRRLSRVSFVPPLTHSFRLRVTETTAHHRRLTVVVAYKNCRRITHVQRRSEPYRPLAFTPTALPTGDIDRSGEAWLLASST